MLFFKSNDSAGRVFAPFILLAFLLTLITPSLARAETSALAKFKGAWVLQEANSVKLVTVSNVSGQGWKVNAQDKDATVDEVNAYHLLVHTTLPNGTKSYYSLALTDKDAAMVEFYQINTDGQRPPIMDQHMNLVRKPQ